MADETLAENTAPESEVAEEKASGKEPEHRESYDDLLRKHKRLAWKHKELEKSVSTLHAHHKLELESKIKSAVEAKERELAKAVKAGDAEEVVRLNREIRAEEKKAETVAKAPAPSTSSEFEEWVDANPWYSKDEKLRKAADEIGNEIRKKDPSMGTEHFLELVTVRMQRKHPEAFEEKKPRTRAVESADDSASRGYGERGRDELGWEDIPRDTRPYFEGLWKQGTWKDKQGKILPKPAAARIYAKELEAIGAIK